MPEQVQNILNKIVEWWKEINVKQRMLMVSIVGVVLVSLGILAFVVSNPQMENLITCASTAEASEVKKLLESEGIDYEVSDDGLEFKVANADMANTIARSERMILFIIVFNFICGYLFRFS